MPCTCFINVVYLLNLIKTPPHCAYIVIRTGWHDHKACRRFPLLPPTKWVMPLSLPSRMNDWPYKPSHTWAQMSLLPPILYVQTHSALVVTKVWRRPLMTKDRVNPLTVQLHAQECQWDKAFRGGPWAGTNKVAIPGALAKHTGSPSVLLLVYYLWPRLLSCTKSSVSHQTAPRDRQKIEEIEEEGKTVWSEG